jgi:hypothetical protein
VRRAARGARGATGTDETELLDPERHSSNVVPHVQVCLKAVGERIQRHAESEREAHGLMLNGQGRRRARGTKAYAKRVPDAAGMRNGASKLALKGVARANELRAAGIAEEAGETGGGAIPAPDSKQVRDPKIPESLAGPEGQVGRAQTYGKSRTARILLSTAPPTTRPRCRFIGHGPGREAHTFALLRAPRGRATRRCIAAIAARLGRPTAVLLFVRLRRVLAVRGVEWRRATCRFNGEA